MKAITNIMLFKQVSKFHKIENFQWFSLDLVLKNLKV